MLTSVYGSSISPVVLKQEDQHFAMHCESGILFLCATLAERCHSAKNVYGFRKRLRNFMEEKSIEAY